MLPLSPRCRFLVANNVLTYKHFLLCDLASLVVSFARCLLRSPDATLTIYNKADLSSVPPSLTQSQIPVSCLTGAGLRDLTSALADVAKSKAWGTSDPSSGSSEVDDILITKRRHRERVAAAHEALLRFEELAPLGEEAIDLASEELRCEFVM